MHPTTQRQDMEGMCHACDASPKLGRKGIGRIFFGSGCSHPWRLTLHDR
jgi:hypothetical protein